MMVDNQVAKLLFINEKSCQGCSRNEEYLHEGVVDADKVGHEVQVATDEHQQKQKLGLAGDDGAASCFPDLQRQPNNGKQMTQVREEAENIHLF